MSIRIIKGSSGPTTTEEVLQLIVASPQGITVKEMCRVLNRPVSMIQICLKALKSSRQVYAQADGAYKPRPSRARSAPHENARQIKYYPRLRPN